MFFLLLRRRRFTYGHPTRPVVGIWKHRVESGRQGMTAVVAAAARAPTFWSHWTFFSCCRCPSFHFLVFLCSNWPARERERRRRTGKREHFRRQVVARKGRCLHINAMQKGQPASTTTSSPLSPFMECKCAKWSRRRSSSRNQTSETGTEKERKKERKRYWKEMDCYTLAGTLWSHSHTSRLSPIRSRLHPWLHSSTPVWVALLFLSHKMKPVSSSQLEQGCLLWMDISGITKSVLFYFFNWIWFEKVGSDWKWCGNLKLDIVNNM